ncbi:MAG: cytochrome c3 family protein [Sphingomonadaceae bacterium]|nr:cytochrome c3 family protein [Sphingomonadaceae bacterium]
MGFRLRTIDLTATGREIVRERQITGSTISIGRAAECDVHLPDLAVEPRHATLSHAGEGMLLAEAAGTLGFTLDGADVTRAEVDLQSGTELGFGTYRVTVAQDAADVLLTVERNEQSATRSGDLEAKRGFALVGVLPGKRIMALALAGTILLAFLLVPVISHALYDSSDKGSTVIGDASWSSGELSLAHHGLEDQCEACHVDAFVSVRDATCTACHKDVHDHADPARLAQAKQGRPWATQFLWSVARGFGKEGPGSCADCHIEHEGKRFSDPPPQSLCADCHGALKDNVPTTRLGNAADFGTQHPQFTPSVVVDPMARRQAGISLDRKPREDHGLSFPHRLHLEQQGGVARMAANIGGDRGFGPDGLQCKDCHRQTEDGVRFRKIEMERDCEGCHSLSYDRVGGIFRKLSHGDVDQLIADLSAGDLSRPPLSLRQRPGQYGPDGPYQFNFSAPAWKGLQIRTALSKGGICGECHRPAVRADGMPGIVPVTLTTRYLEEGWFDHGAHKQEQCTSCHAAQTSDTASQLLLPGIETCRTCHAGETGSEADVPSTCAMCHSYHAPSLRPRGRDAHKKKGS